MNDPNAKTSTVANNCSAPLPIVYVKDTGNGPVPPLFFQHPGRLFAYLVLNPQQRVQFDLADAYIGQAGFLACPGIPAQEAPLICALDAPGGPIAPPLVPQATEPLFDPYALQTTGLPSAPPPYVSSTPPALLYGTCFVFSPGSPQAKAGDPCSCLKGGGGTLPGHLSR